jgi:hypothetical protein
MAMSDGQVRVGFEKRQVLMGKLAELFLSAAEVSYDGQSHASGLSKIGRHEFIRADCNYIRPRNRKL